MISSIGFFQTASIATTTIYDRLEQAWPTEANPNQAPSYEDMRVVANWLIQHHPSFRNYQQTSIVTQLASNEPRATSDLYRIAQWKILLEIITAVYQNQPAQLKTATTKSWFLRDLENKSIPPIAPSTPRPPEEKIPPTTHPKPVVVRFAEPKKPAKIPMKGRHEVPNTLSELIDSFKPSVLDQYLAKARASSRDPYLRKFSIRFVLNSEEEIQSLVLDTNEKPSHISKASSIEIYKTQQGKYVIGYIYGTKSNDVYARVKSKRFGRRISLANEAIVRRGSHQKMIISEKVMRALTIDEFEYLTSSSKSSRAQESTTTIEINKPNITSKDEQKRPINFVAGKSRKYSYIQLVHGFDEQGNFKAEIVSVAGKARGIGANTQFDLLKILIEHPAFEGSHTRKLFRIRESWFRNYEGNVTNFKSLNYHELNTILDYLRIVHANPEADEFTLRYKIKRGRVSEISLGIKPATPLAEDTEEVVFKKNEDIFVITKATRVSETTKRFLRNYLDHETRYLEHPETLPKRTKKKTKESSSPSGAIIPILISSNKPAKSGKRKPKKTKESPSPRRAITPSLVPSGKPANPPIRKPKQVEELPKAPEKPIPPTINPDLPKIEEIPAELIFRIDRTIRLSDRKYQLADKKARHHTMAFEHIAEGVLFVRGSDEISGVAVKRVAELAELVYDDLSLNDQRFIDRIQDIGTTQITESIKIRVRDLAQNTELTAEVTIAEYLEYRYVKARKSLVQARTTPEEKRSPLPKRAHPHEKGYLIIPRTTGFNDEIDHLLANLEPAEREKLLASLNSFGTSVRNALQGIAEAIDFNALMTEIFRASEKGRTYTVTIISPEGDQREITGHFNQLRDELMLAKAQGCTIEASNPLLMLSIKHPQLFKKIKTLFISEVLGTPVLMQTIIGKTGIGGLNFMVADIISDIAVGDWKKVSLKHAFMTWLVMGSTGTVISSVVDRAFHIYELSILEKKGHQALQSLLNNKDYLFIKHQAVRLFSTLFGLIAMQAIESGQANFVESAGQIVKLFIPAHLITAGIMRILSTMIQGFKINSGLGLVVGSIIDFIIFKLGEKGYVLLDHHQEQQNILEHTTPSLVHLRDGKPLTLVNARQIEQLADNLDQNDITHTDAYRHIAELSGVLTQINPSSDHHRNLMVLLREPKRIEEQWRNYQRAQIVSDSKTQKENQAFRRALREAQDRAYQRMKAYIQVSPMIKEIREKIDQEIAILIEEGRDYEVLSLRNELAKLWIRFDRDCFEMAYQTNNDELLEARMNLQFAAEYGKYQREIAKLEEKEITRLKTNPTEMRRLAALIFFGIDQTNPRYLDVIHAMELHGYFLADPVIRESFFAKKPGTLKEVILLKRKIKEEEENLEQTIHQLLQELKELDQRKASVKRRSVNSPDISAFVLMNQREKLARFLDQEKKLERELQETRIQLAQIGIRNHQIHQDLTRLDGYGSALSRLEPDTVFAIQKDAIELAILAILDQLELTPLYYQYQQHYPDLTARQLVLKLSQELDSDQQENLRLALIKIPYFTEDSSSSQESELKTPLPLPLLGENQTHDMLGGIKSYAYFDDLIILGEGSIRSATTDEIQRDFVDHGHLDLPKVNQAEIVRMNPLTRKAFFKLIADKAKIQFDLNNEPDISLILSFIEENKAIAE